MFKSSETGGRGKWGFHGDTAIKKKSSSLG